MIEDIIKAYLPGEASYAECLREAMNYSVLSGGKRVRPTLMLETYRLFGGQSGVIEPFMAAIEMIHSYSLVHDDLPAIDNDELRRGHPTTWKKYGEATGVLTGDALLTYAFETAAKAFDMGDPSAVGRAIGVLAHKAGLYGMCGGEYVDTEVTGRPASEDQMDYIYRLKTGALLECAMMIGAILAGACDDDVEICRQIGLDLGMAFQIRDDILDIISTEEELGKPIGSDEKNGKITYATIHGTAESERAVAAYSGEAIKLLEKLPGDKEFFRSFIKKLETRRN
ncbi:MAG: polyprenyl synthetase family protein [Lachnospiraceae bacterium]|nr:polyprenyl synthetase family protein [Lachnospiraceae bacterium]